MSWAGGAAAAPQDAPADRGLAFGGEIQERVEYSRPLVFGLTGVREDEAALHRLLAHVDWRLTGQMRLFAELGTHVQTGRDTTPMPTDVDRLDLTQAYLDLSAPAGDGRLTLRAGRQQFGLGSSRLVSTREGLNVKRSFDGARLLFEQPRSHTQALLVAPVDIERGVFDDRTSRTELLWGLYRSQSLGATPGTGVDLDYLGYSRQRALFAQGRHHERRHSIGTRLYGKQGAGDYDVEALYQFGSFGPYRIAAWTVSSNLGVTAARLPLQPRFGLKVDLASGDGDLGDDTLGTFNALYPRPTYLTEASLVAPANILDVHPSVTATLASGLTLQLGWDVLWRHRRADAFYTPPLVPIAGTTGGGRFVGHQPHVDVAWKISPSVSLNGSYVHFFTGGTLERAGAHDVDFAVAWLKISF